MIFVYNEYILYYNAPNATYNISGIGGRSGKNVLYVIQMDNLFTSRNLTSKT